MIEEVIESAMPIEAKPLLTLGEAAEYTNIGINKLREISDEEGCNFVLFVGNKRLLKKDKMVSYLLGQLSI